MAVVLGDIQRKRGRNANKYIFLGGISIPLFVFLSLHESPLTLSTYSKDIWICGGLFLGFIGILYAIWFKRKSATIEDSLSFSFLQSLEVCLSNLSSDFIVLRSIKVEFFYIDAIIVCNNGVYILHALDTSNYKGTEPNCLAKDEEFKFNSAKIWQRANMVQLIVSKFLGREIIVKPIVLLTTFPSRLSFKKDEIAISGLSSLESCLSYEGTESLSKDERNLVGKFFYERYLRD